MVLVTTPNVRVDNQMKATKMFQIWEFIARTLLLFLTLHEKKSTQLCVIKYIESNYTTNWQTGLLFDVLKRSFWLKLTLYKIVMSPQITLHLYWIFGFNHSSKFKTINHSSIVIPLGRASRTILQQGKLVKTIKRPSATAQLLQHQHQRQCFKTKQSNRCTIWKKKERTQCFVK